MPKILNNNYSKKYKASDDKECLIAVCSLFSMHDAPQNHDLIQHIGS